MLKEMKPLTGSVGVRLVAVAALCAALPGCGGLSKALGLEKSSPDEFAIVTKAPLVVPPEFTLRPPKPGMPRPQEKQAADVAAQVLLTGAEVSGGQSSVTRGETLLLSEAGALDTDSSIRQVLMYETQKVDKAVATEDDDGSFFDTVFFWRGSDKKAKEDAVADASAPKSAEDGAAKDESRDRRKGWF